MAQERDFVKQAKDFWSGQQKSGHNGLVLLRDLMAHTATHRDWDALATFLSRAGTERAFLWRVVRMSFGDKIEAKVDKKGLRFKLLFDGAYDLERSNGFGAVNKAIEMKKSFRAKELRDDVNAYFKKEPVKKEHSELLKGVFKYLQKASKDNGVPLSTLVAAMQEAAKHGEVRVKHEEPDF